MPEESQEASRPELHRRPHVLLAASGSVATIKLPELHSLLSGWAELKVIATSAAQHFYDQEDDAWLGMLIYGDKDDWREWDEVGDEVLHVELRRWADVLIIAPLSANTLAKVAQGLCDNLLTCVVRAWDMSRPRLVAPAMNTMMWDSPFTEKHLRVLTEELGFAVIDPVSKKLACGDIGNGAMASPHDIDAAVRKQYLSSCCSSKIVDDEQQRL